MREVYLDNSATTMVCNEAVKKAVEIMTSNYGNPSSLHSKGIEAERELNTARGIIAGKLNVDSNDIFFTSGGTEANNLAILGSVNAMRKKTRIVTTMIEHSSVLDSISYLEKTGIEVVWLKTDEKGQISEKDLNDAITPDTMLVSIMAVNNEIGTILPYKAAARAIKRKKSSALLHVDAVQGFCKIPLDPSFEGVDLMSISSHKIHGPKGVGALYVKKGTKLLPLMFGGGQEQNLRPGTEALPLIAAFGAAVQQMGDNSHMKTLNSYARKRLIEIPEVTINSPDDALECILNFSAVGVRSETMLHHLAANGVYVSSGSACAMGKPSHVLQAMNLPSERADSAIRLSFSRYNTQEDVDRMIDALKSGLNNIIRSV